MMNANTDFENLRLPNETRQYVPKLLAVRKRYDPEHRFVSYLDDAG